MRSPLPTALRRAAPPLAVALAAVSFAGAQAPATASARPAPAEATAPGAATLAPASPDLPGMPPMSMALADVAVDSAPFRRAAAAYGEVASAHAASQQERVSIDQARTELGSRAGVLEAQLVAARARMSALRSRLDEVERAIGDLSVQLYLSGGASKRIDAALTEEQPSINDSDRRAVLGNASLDVLLAERQAYQARVDATAARIEAASEEREAVEAERTSAADRRPAVTADEVSRSAAVAEARVEYERARVLAEIEGVDFPLVALDAYHRAATSIERDLPACGLRWWAIAGISRVEGHHGTYGGSTLDERGDTTKRIIGIQLNGTNETAVIADSDDGALDGDPHFDRAVGPMQFIPQTWARFASDGNDDQIATPFNLYDATLAAARYLCRASGGLGEDPGLRRAYFSYNHSEAYVERVLSFARLYQHSVEVPDLTP